MTKQIWVFNGAGGRFPSGVFSSRESAASWIRQRGLTGVLTAYPLNEGAYEWAVANRFFTPKSDEHTSSEFIQRFTSASQEHFHFENGDSV
jgi:hypothetical protein